MWGPGEEVVSSSPGERPQEEPALQQLHLRPPEWETINARAASALTETAREDQLLSHL